MAEMPPAYGMAANVERSRLHNGSMDAQSFVVTSLDGVRSGESGQARSLPVTVIMAMSVGGMVAEIGCSGESAGYCGACGSLGNRAFRNDLVWGGGWYSRFGGRSSWVHKQNFGRSRYTALEGLRPLDQRRS